MKITSDPDIGMCDDCGSEDGDRWPRKRRISVGGSPEMVTAWLCQECAER